MSDSQTSSRLTSPEPLSPPEPLAASAQTAPLPPLNPSPVLSSPFQSAPDAGAPLPYLTGADIGPGADPDVWDWRSAPPGPRDAFTLAVLAASLYGLGAIVTIFVSEDRDSSRFLVPLILLIPTALAVLLAVGIRKRFSAIWVIQIIISCLWLINFPIGTLLHGFLLSKWFKPETKAWFRVS